MAKWWITSGILSIILLSTAAWVQFNEQSASDRFKQEFLYRINKARAAGCSCGKQYMPPAPPLTWNANLEAAAIAHAQDMNNRNYFSHTSKDGRTSEDRIVAAGYSMIGYRSLAVGENIAFGQTSIAEVSDGWFKSEGHCHNLMSREFKEIGVAHVGQYWTQEFGGRETFTPEQQKMLKEGRGRLIIRKESTE
ncbi:CAP domain-containing protein [Mucilaginibacter agri]|uniref:CAP domain-containing protein n=1 Tax=Mucilaginibacter agri TaxID=2695265 RepID=A0A966DW22_9SPHI|nr:CAP domain-containing protein [Mucilaginibacter agri]NCD72052.1 CAP domain-containing protein [Mucilaginibacter agri]